MGKVYSPVLWGEKPLPGLAGPVLCRGLCPWAQGNNAVDCSNRNSTCFGFLMVTDDLLHLSFSLFIRTGL
jgi:hypothetical protein